MPEPLAGSDDDELGGRLRSILTGPLNNLLESHLAVTDGISEIRAAFGEEALSEAIDRVTTEYTKDFPRHVANALQEKLQVLKEPQALPSPEKEPLPTISLPTTSLTTASPPTAPLPTAPLPTAPPPTAPPLRVFPAIVALHATQLPSATQPLLTTKEIIAPGRESPSINQPTAPKEEHERDISQTINNIDSRVSGAKIPPLVLKDGEATGNKERTKDLPNSVFPSNSRNVTADNPINDKRDTDFIYSKSSLVRKSSADTNLTISRASSTTEEHPLTNSSATSDFSEERPLTNSSAASDRLKERPLTISCAASNHPEECPLINSSATSNHPKPAPTPPPPAEYAKYADEFITKNLGKLYDPKSPEVQWIMKTAAAKAKEIMEKYELSPELSLGLTKLALYDFVILCDDSSSMKRENRIEALKSTLKRVAEIATLIEPSGISIRFLNYRHDSSFNNLTNMDTINPKIEDVKFRGITQLGTMLDNKIIQPMVMRKIQTGTFQKPLIVVMITDGEPFGEPKSKLEQVIRSCKTSETLNKFGEAAVVFVISRVGSSKDAKVFLGELHDDEELKEWVYCSMDRLDEQSAVMQRVSNNVNYTKKLIKLFLAALDSQTE